MSKKVISIVLSVAMVVAVLCVGFGAVTASADTVTYYFLAPENFLLAEGSGDKVGYYYWQPEEIAPWPGAEMTKAPEVGERVYKVEAPDMDATGTIIFNAFVDAGNPADPALAAVAHQTVNINTEGYMKGESKLYETLDNFYGMIYVLSSDPADVTVNEFSGATQTKGEWFSIDSSSEYYYKNYLDDAGNYYSLKKSTDPTPAPSGKQYHAGDKVTVSFSFGGVDPAGTLTSFVEFNNEVLKYEGKEKKVTTTGTVLVNDNLSEEVDSDGRSMANRLGIGCVFDPTGEEHTFAGDKVTMFEFTFTALKDFDLADAGIQRVTTEITTIKDDDVADVFVNDGYDATKEDNYTKVDVNVECNHTPVDPSSTTSSDTSSVAPSSSTPEESSSSASASSETSSTKSEESKTSSKASSAATSSKATGDASKNSSSSKAGSTSSNKTGSNGTSSNGAAVQTAGTFAVVSLVVILMAAAAVVLYTRKKTEE